MPKVGNPGKLRSIWRLNSWARPKSAAYSSNVIAMNNTCPTHSTPLLAYKSHRWPCMETTGVCACPTAWACQECIAGGIAAARAAHGEEEATGRAVRHKAHKADILRTAFERRAAKIQANRERKRSET